MLDDELADFTFGSLDLLLEDLIDTGDTKENNTSPSRLKTTNNMDETDFSKRRFMARGPCRTDSENVGPMCQTSRVLKRMPKDNKCVDLDAELDRTMNDWERGLHWALDECSETKKPCLESSRSRETELVRMVEQLARTVLVLRQPCPTQLSSAELHLRFLDEFRQNHNCSPSEIVASSVIRRDLPAHIGVFLLRSKKSANDACESFKNGKDGKDEEIVCSCTGDQFVLMWCKSSGQFPTLTSALTHVLTQISSP